MKTMKRRDVLKTAAAMVAGGAVAWLVGRILKLAMLSWADRLAGAALGLLGALVAAALVAHPIVAAAPGGSRLLNGSRLAPYVTVVADLANALAPRDLAERYTEGIGALRRAWRGQTGPQAQPPRARGRD